MKVLALATLASSAFVCSVYSQNCEQITASVHDLMVLMSNPLMNGLHCTEAQQQALESASTCTDNGGEQPLIAQLNAQTKCLRDFIERRQRLTPGPQTPVPNVPSASF